jgi:uncharacterized Fe-S cluster-containing radical SAM superfamily protein
MTITRHLRNLWQGRAPGQLIIQMTERCNARCPQCGMRATEPFARSSLSVEYVKRLLDAAIERGITMVSFTGGEPFLMLDDVIEVIVYAGRLGFPYIRTGTNGYLFQQPSDANFRARIARIADRLAATPLRNLWISVDSAVPGIHAQMRGFPDVMAGIEKALPIFHERGLYPSANVGLNRNLTDRTAALTQRIPPDHPDYLQTFYYEFRAAFAQLYRQIVNLGFTMASACYPMSVENAMEGTGLESVYAATASDAVVRFSGPEKAQLYTALFDTIPAFRSELRIITPLTSLYALIRQHTSDGGDRSYACRGGLDYFFVDARQGTTYPCGYRGQEDLGNLWELDRKVLGTRATCYACDWECFRDPAELLGPILQGRTHPLALLKRMRRDPQFFRLWMQDVRYIRTCDFFDGRRPPDTNRLRRLTTDRSATMAALSPVREGQHQRPSSDLALPVLPS